MGFTRAVGVSIAKAVYLVPLRHRYKLAQKITRDMDSYCKDCDKRVFDYYMVQHRLWRTHGVGEGYLHLECLEKRMYRKLKLSDFIPNIPVNELLFRAAAMAA